MTIRSGHVRLVMATALLASLAAMPALGTGAHEADGTGADASQWLCQFCIWPTGWRGFVEAGPGYLSERSLPFADYRGLDEKGGYPALAGQAHYLDGEGRYLDLRARDFGLDSRGLDTRGGRRGRYQWRLGWSEIPKYRGFGTRTPFLGVGGGVLTLPGNWVPASGTTGMTGLAEALKPVALRTERQTLDVGFSLRFASRWQWDVDVQRIRKDGTRPFSGGLFLVNSSHFPAPVDFTTDRVDLALSRAGEHSSFNVSLSGSWFENGHSSVTWENPFAPFAGTERLRSALEPDNQAHSLTLGGAWSPLGGVRLSARLSLGRARQNEAFLPYTINPLIPSQPLPRDSLLGKIEAQSFNFAGRLTARLNERLDVTARLRLDDRDNRTPVTLWTPVITDFVTRPETRNRPYSFERRNVTLEARFRARPGLSLRGGAGREEIERSLQSVVSTRETTVWGEAGFDRWESVRLRFKLESADRNASPYLTVVDPGLPENPLMRKFNLADRQRRRGVLEADLMPHDRLDLTLSWYLTDDDYGRSPLGLQESEESGVNIDASYRLTRGAGLNAFVSSERIDALIASQQDFTLPWDARTRDAFLTAGLGFKLQLSQRWTSGLDYVYSKSEGRIRAHGAGEDGAFPRLDNELRNLRAYLGFQAGPHWQWKVFAEHERYKSSDWQLDGLDVDGIQAILTMGLVSPDYRVTALRLAGIYHF